MWNGAEWRHAHQDPGLEDDTDALVVVVPGSQTGVVLVVETGKAVLSFARGDLAELGVPASAAGVSGYTEWMLDAAALPLARVPLAEYNLLPLHT